MAGALETGQGRPRNQQGMTRAEIAAARDYNGLLNLMQRKSPDSTPEDRHRFALKTLRKREEEAALKRQGSAKQRPAAVVRLTWGEAWAMARRNQPEADLETVRAIARKLIGTRQNEHG